MRNLGCTACHQLPNDVKPFPHQARVPADFPEMTREAMWEGYSEAYKEGRIPPSLNRAGERLRPEWVYDYLRRPRAIRRHLAIRMPSFDLTPVEALSLTEFLMTLKKEERPEPPPDPPDPALAEKGKGLLKKWQCEACHGEKPTGAVAAPLHRIVLPRLKPSWIVPWIRTPGALDPAAAVMPDNKLPPDEEATLAAYLRSLGPVDERLVKAYAAAKKALPSVTAEAGKQLAQDFNCAGCHAMGGNPRPRSQFAPSIVRGSSRFRRVDDFVAFLRRPVSDAHEDPGRMPDFRLSAEEAKAVATYLFGLSLVDLGEGVEAGFRAKTLPLPARSMGHLTGAAVDDAGRPFFVNYEGDLIRILDRNGDGLAETAERIGSGLDLALGLAIRGKDFYAAQRSEMTRLRDTDGDGFIDRYEAVFGDWYTPVWNRWIHNIFSFGPAIGPDGTAWFAGTTARYFPDQGLSTRGGLRGIMLAAAPDGKTRVFSRGHKVPYGIAVNAKGELFDHDNDHGFGHGGLADTLFHVREGRYYRHALPDWDRTAFPAGEEPILHFTGPYGSTACGITFWPEGEDPYAGQMLVPRFAAGVVARVELIPSSGDEYNVAVYPFVTADQATNAAVGKDGTVWIATIRGRVVRVRRTNVSAQGLASIRIPDAGRLRLTAREPLSEKDRKALVETSRYEIRLCHEEEAPPDPTTKLLLGRMPAPPEPVAVKGAKILGDGKSVELEVDAFKLRCNYTISVAGWPGPFPKAVYLYELNSNW